MGDVAPELDDLLGPVGPPETQNAAPAATGNGVECIEEKEQPQPELYADLADLLGPIYSPLDRPLQVTRFDDVKAKRLEPATTSLRNLADTIRTTRAAEKAKLPLIKLATFGDIPTPKGALRHDANLVTVDGIEGDYDAKQVSVAEAVERLTRAGVAALVHSSPSHAPDAPKWRVLAPLSAAATPDDRDTMVARLNGALGGILAGESFARSQAFYVGGVTGEPEVHLIEGRFLDHADDVAPMGKAAAKPAPAAPGTDESRSGRAFALAGECHRNGLDIAAFRVALGREPDLAEWASDDRQVERAWRRSTPDSFADLFDDLAGEESDFALNEDGVARAFAAKYRDTLRFDHTAGRWFRWSGAHWRREETPIAFHFCRETCRAAAKADPLSAAAKVMSKAASASAVERYARADPLFATTSTQWDGDAWLLGTPGGTVDLRTGDLRPAEPGDMITRLAAATPVPADTFNADRDCPRWIAFLHDATGGDAESIRFLRQWSGYALTGDTREEALLFIHGPGGSGKSTWINTLADALGDYAVNVDPATITASKFDRHSTELARLKGARLARASETEAGRSWAEARIKALTGGDVITARFMRRDDFEFKPEFKLTIVGNHRPSIQNVDEAMRRRFNVMPFDHPPKRADEGLKDALQRELPGILAWAIAGCLDWQTHGLIRPAVVTETTAAYFDSQDTFGAWLDDDCETGPDLADTTATLWASWSVFARTAGEDPGTKVKAFPDRLRSRGFEAIQSQCGIRGRGWRGLKVKEGYDGFDDLGVGE